MRQATRGAGADLAQTDTRRRREADIQDGHVGAQSRMRASAAAAVAASPTTMMSGWPPAVPDSAPDDLVIVQQEHLDRRRGGLVVTHSPKSSSPEPGEATLTRPVVSRRSRPAGRLAGLARRPTVQPAAPVRSCHGRRCSGRSKEQPESRTYEAGPG